MTLDIRRLAIPDVRLIVPRRFADARGYLVETHSERTFEAAGIETRFRQDNQSLSSQRGTIRGLHFQRRPSPQTKLVRVVTGAIFDVAVDLRAGSATYGRWCGDTLTAEAGEEMLIPVGFAHAFCTLQPDTIVAYKVDGFYDRDAEAGVRWDDPDIAIEWPVPAAEIKLSEKDAALPFLRDAATPFDFGRRADAGACG